MSEWKDTAASAAPCRGKVRRLRRGRGAGIDEGIRMEEKMQASPDDGTFQHQFEELQRRASKDALSGLLNRVTAEQYIKDRLAAMGPEDSCALMIVDLDDFKQVNDTLGHQAGDQAIRRSAQILSGLFRAKDIVGRLGGDEFVVFLCGKVTDALVRKKGKAICEYLQLSLGTGPVVNLTASVGIYMAQGSGLHFEGLYQSADLALYKVKKSGKHSFCIKYGENARRKEPEEDFHPVSTIPLTGLLEYMDSGVALLEMDDPIRIIYVSPSFCRLLDTDPQAYTLPKTLDELIHPDDQEMLQQALWKGLEHDCPVDHMHRVSADGMHWPWWHIRAVRIDYDSPHPVMLVTTTDISQFKENEHRLQEINERLLIAFDQTDQRLWEVDMASHFFRIFDRDGKFCTPNPEQMLFPEALISNGWIHSNSVPRFQEFAKGLLSGQTQGYGNFIVQYQDTGCYSWAALSYRMLFDNVGRPVKAVGIIESLPQNFVGEEARSILKRPLPEALVPDLVLGLRANLTQNAVKELWSEGKNLSGQARMHTCAEILKQEADKLFYEDDRQRLAQYFDREQLLALFADGERWLQGECCRADGSGSIRWIHMVLNLAEDPLTHEIYLFFYLIQRDACHRWESELERAVSRDPVTKLYDRESIRMLAESLLGRDEPGLCGVAMVQMGGICKLYANDPQALDQKRAYAAAALSVSFGGECLIGQYSTDQIVMLFPQIRSEMDLKSQIEECFSFLRLVLAGVLPMDCLRFVAGIICKRVKEADYDTMLLRARHSCALRRNAGADTVAIADENEDWTWTDLQGQGEDDRITVHQAEMRRPLSDGEKDMAFQCVTAMLSADSLETSIRSVLSDIGTYYHADRVYVLMLAENQHVITMPYEWTDPRKRSIQQAVSGMRVEHFPLLTRCIEERAPVFLSRTVPLSSRKEEKEHVPWYFTTFPLIEHDTIKGFLCVENSREHPADAALFSTLMPYILRERERFERRGGLPAEVSTTFLTEMPNLRSYMEVIYSLNSDRYTSMGAVCLDIPALSAINGRMGFEYGSKLLWYVSKTLTDIFGPSLLFRTWDAEFVALCPNTTKQVFVGRCMRLRTTLERRYPQKLRIGYTWAEGVFAGKNLVDEARTLMRCESAENNDVEALVMGHGRYHSVSEAAQGGRFTVVFQPQVDMRSGKLLGVEALVRGIDDDGTLIAPGRFIDELEKTGGIRELDLFVLDRALSCAAHWCEYGAGVIPVSVNFSRITLFNPSALASVLAIQSRYPELPANALELEITESAGNVESANFQMVMDRFRQCGIRFGLDDFGSQYANLSVFADVKFDTVKLDRSMIAKLTNNQINRMLVQDIVRICRTCGMDCVAEGVETEAQVTALVDAGCICAQGYYYDRPLSAERFEEKYLRSVQSGCTGS